MEDELELELQTGVQPQINRTQERINSLTSKLGDVSREKEEALRKAEEAERKAQEAEKNLKFVSDFSEMVPKYQAASEYRDAIKEKVDAGYTIEDATVAVLNANGKLIPQAQEEPVIETAPIAGGSAPTQLPTQAKSPSEFTQDDLRAELSKPERAADLEQILRNGLR